MSENCEKHDFSFELPDLSKANIIAHLFNNELMSDVQFQIDGKILFAHSWRLMDQSVVFQSQMRDTMDENKLVLIEDISYDAFYQFIRFIYTDQCDINEHNEIELLKMARRYKVIPLETKIINKPKATLKLFQYCVLEKYNLAYHKTREELSKNPTLFKDQLSTVHPDVLEEILKLDYLDNLKEHELFELLMVWINKSCETNQIPLTQRRSHFDKFFKLIRFSAMTGEGFSTCVRKHVDLFTNDYMSTIFKAILFGSDSQNTTWNSKSRLPFNLMYRKECTDIVDLNECLFKVSRPVILSALRVTALWYSTVVISFNDPTTQKNCSKTYSLQTGSYDISKLLIFGESIVLKPDVKYRIIIATGDHYSYRCSEDVILSGPSDIIQFQKNGATWLHEIIYKLETD